MSDFDRVSNTLGYVLPVLPGAALGTFLTPRVLLAVAKDRVDMINFGFPKGETIILERVLTSGRAMNDKPVRYALPLAALAFALVAVKSSPGMPLLPPWSHMAAALVLPAAALPALCYLELRSITNAMLEDPPMSNMPVN